MFGLRAFALAFAISQSSALVSPLFLDEAPPELRSARQILLVHRDSPPSARSREISSNRSPEEALELAERIVARLEAGVDFEELALQYSSARNAKRGAVLGTFARGVLLPELDRFLFTAEMGETSKPLVTDEGVFILRRIDVLAGVLRIEVKGKDEAAQARVARLREQLKEGADFAELAREHSDDATSAARGGQYQIFERGPDDRDLKRAAFDMDVGDVAGPLQGPLGFDFIKRVALEDMDPALRETTSIRLRSILITHNESVGVVKHPYRTRHEAFHIADEIFARIEAGEDMATLAKEFNEDPGGRERAGDLGWVHRRTPDMTRFMSRSFFLKPGERVKEPISTGLGYVILRRER